MSEKIYPKNLIQIIDERQQIYFGCFCTECNSINWTYVGRIDDETKVDVEGFQCYYCKKEFFFSEEEEKLAKEYHYTEDGNYQECCCFAEGKKERPECLKKLIK
jgi:hypothetical protein